MKKGNVRLFCLVVGLMMILGHHFGSRSSGTTLSFSHVLGGLPFGGLPLWLFDWGIVGVVLLRPAPLVYGGVSAEFCDWAPVISWFVAWQGKSCPPTLSWEDWTRSIGSWLGLVFRPGFGVSSPTPLGAARNCVFWRPCPRRLCLMPLQARECHSRMVQTAHCRP